MGVSQPAEWFHSACDYYLVALWWKNLTFQSDFCACLHVCVDAKKIVGSIRLKCVAWTRQKHEVSDLIQLIQGRYFAMNTLYADHYSEMHPLIPIVTSCSVWNGLHRHAQRWNHNAFTTLQRPEGRGWTLNLMCLNQGRRREFYTYLNAGRSRTALHRNMS